MTQRMAATVEHPVYETVMALLAVLSVAVLVVEAPWVRPVNLAVYAVFVVDYVVRLAVAEDRWRFVRTNVVDLVAIVPADLFRLARVARLARLARAGSLVWRASSQMRAVLAENGLGTVLLAVAGTVVAGAAAVWVVDPAFTSFGDALWWAVVTATTVGYGDLAPTNPVSRGVATVMMFAGIGAVGMLTGSLATYFADRPSDTGAGGGAEVRLPDGRTFVLDEDQTGHLVVVLRGVGLDA